MAKDNYRIDGSGKNTREADKALKGKRDALVERLRNANASTDLEVARSHYTARFNLKGDCSSEVCVRHLELESEEGWKPIRIVASQQLASVRRYEASYGVEQYLALTAEQEEALKPKSTRTPAGYEPRPESSIDRLIPRL